MSELANTASAALQPRAHHTIVMATLNVNGLPRVRQDARTRSLLPPYQARHRALCDILEASPIDIINLQEVFTHRDRRLFEKHLPSFDYTAFEWSPLGPKGALATFSRLPLTKVSYESYLSAAQQADRSELPRTALAKSALKGMLVSRLTEAPLTVINTHPLANDDWDWRRTNRFRALQAAQLGKLASTAAAHSIPTERHVVVGGDLNVAKDSDLFDEFLASSQLHDAFIGDDTPTFHDAFLNNASQARCIDYLLTSGSLRISNPTHIVTSPVPLAGYGPAYLTDHLGLQATLNFS